MAVHIGTSGWSYDHWVGVLYPQIGVEPRAAGRLRPAVPDGRGEQHLLPLAEGRGLRDLARAAAGGVPRLGQGVAGPDPVPQAERPGAVARADGGGAVPPGGEAGRDCSSSSRPTSRSTSTGSTASSAVVPVGPAGRRGVPPPDLGRRGDVRGPGTPRRGLLRHERGEPAVRAPGDGGLRLRPPPRPGPRSTCTPARTPRTTSAGGPTGSASGGRRAATSSPTSTTTATATPSATPCGSGNWSGSEADLPTSRR